MPHRAAALRCEAAAPSPAAKTAAMHLPSKPTLGCPTAYTPRRRRCRRLLRARRETARWSMPASASCLLLTTPCCLAASSAITSSVLAGCARISSISRQLRPLAPSLPLFRVSTFLWRCPGAGAPSLPVFARAYPVGAMPASAQYSVTVRVELDARQEPLGKLTAQIAEAGGALQSVDLIPGAGPEGKRVREFTIDANSPEHWEQILRSIGSTRGARVLGYIDRTFEMHKKGKIEQHNKYPLKTRDDLSMAYTPGVARVCEYIAEDKSKAFDFTIKANTVAVV